MQARKAILIVSCLLATLIVHGAAVVHVNETVEDFMISFDVKDDTNAIGKYWSPPGPARIDQSINVPVVPVPIINIHKSRIVLAGNISDDRPNSSVMVLILKKPVNTTDAEREFFKSSTYKYIRIYDKIMDKHKGILVLSGNGPDDPLMNYSAIYWLDEANGMATELVCASTALPWSDGAETLINTVHVEKIGSL